MPSKETLLDKVCMFVAWKLLPRRLIRWCVVRVGANATTGIYSNQKVMELTFMKALDRWSD